MTSSISISTGRIGIVMRVLPHGSVIVFDRETQRSYPFYKAGLETYHAMEQVRFVTDATDTVIVSLHRLGSTGEGKAQPGVVGVSPIAAAS